MDIGMNTDNEVRFWDKIARRYAAKSIADQAAYEKTLARTRAWLKKDHTVLELGCGTGSTAILHAPHVRHITGSDISPEMIAIANEKLADGPPANADFVVAIPDDERFQHQSYDIVLALNFLHLVHDLPATLTRIRALLKPGGLLIAKTACVGDMGFAPRMAIPVMRAIGKAPFVNFFGKEKLKELICNAGFEIEESGLHARKGHNLFIVASSK